MDIGEAIVALEGVRRELRELVKRDPEHEVQGVALRVLDTAVAEARKLIADHPIVEAFGDMISPEAVESGLSVRGADLLLALEPLLSALYTARGPIGITRVPR